MGPSRLSGIVEDVQIKDIRYPEYLLRDQLDGLDELIVSIREKGLLQPIIVRPLAEGFELVAGRRRLDACKRLGAIKIACHVVEMDDKEAFEVALTENVQQRTLNPIEEAKAFKKYTDDYGYGGVSELACRIGKSQEYVTRRIQLFSLPSSLKEEIMRRRITPSVAQELSQLGAKEAEKIAEIALTEGLSSREVRRMVKHHRKLHVLQELPTSPFAVSPLTKFERSILGVDRALTRCIVSLKVSMLQFDEILNSLNDSQWFVAEVLIHHRRTLHHQVDSLLSLRSKTRRSSYFLSTKILYTEIRPYQENALLDKSTHDTKTNEKQIFSE